MTVELHLGDCLEVMRGMADKSVDAVITDPPYGLDRGSFFAKRARGIPEERIDWDASAPSREYFTEISRVGDKRIIWGANYFNCFSERGGAIVWNKLQPLDNLSQAEIASYSGSKKVYMYTERWTNFVNTKETDHPTEKSIGLIKWCVERFTTEGDTILDPFMGSGTTGVACVQTGRNFIGCEIDPGYFAIADKRIKEAQLQTRMAI